MLQFVVALLEIIFNLVKDWAKSTSTAKVRAPPAAGTRMASFMWRAAEGGCWPNIGAHDVTQALTPHITLFHVTDKMSWSQPRDNWSNYWFARRGRQVCCSSATSSSSAAPSGPGSSISSQDNFHLIITAKIFINCDHDPLSLMSGHSKRYNCPLVRVTAAIDSSLQHSVPENIYCLLG